MAHNLNYNTEKETYSFVDARMPAWHGLGQVVNGALNWEEAMRLANLDFEVSKVRMRNPITDEPVDSWGMIRTDNNAFLGAVGERYTPIQNKFLFNFIDEVVGRGGMHYETAGALGKGEQVWVMANAGGYDVLSTGDKHDCYLLGVGSHDGSMSQVFKMTSTRVVCQNTLNIALSRSGTAVKAKHTLNGEAKLNDALSLIQRTQATMLNTQQVMEELAQRKVKPQAIADTLASLFNIKTLDSKLPTVTANQVEQVRDLFESNDRDAFPEFRGTAYNLLNSLTEYADHYRNVRGGDELTQRAVSAMFGTGDKFKTQAMETVLRLTAQAERTNQPKAYSLPSDTDDWADIIG